MVYRKVRPQTYEKSVRNGAIVEYHRSHPEATMGDIGGIFGVSRARAYQIIKRAEHQNGKTLSAAINECGGRDARGN